METPSRFFPTPPQLEELTTPDVTAFLETRRRYERIMDDKNASLLQSNRIPEDCDFS